MNKITIPALLLGVVMIAGAFAFMPVQEASTVHTSAANLANQSVIKTVTETELTVTAAQVITIDLDAPFTLLSFSISCDGGDTVDAAGGGDCGASESMDVASFVRDGEATAQTLVLTKLDGDDTEANPDEVLFPLNGNAASVATDQVSITVADRIAFTMANDIVDTSNAADGFDITVTAVVLTAGSTVFDATDITFS
jgi:hypothetical protein